MNVILATRRNFTAEVIEVFSQR